MSYNECRKDGMCIMLWYSTTENEKWTLEVTYSDQKGTKIEIGEPVGKELFGFGCRISEICAKAVFSLSEEKQKEIFDELFSDSGCGFNYCRLSIGANDFAESWYSYNETENDYAMEHFSIDREKNISFPPFTRRRSVPPRLNFLHLPGAPRRG